MGSKQNIRSLKLYFYLFFFCLLLFPPGLFARPLAPPAPVHLAVILVFDQMRADYLTRFSRNFLPARLPDGRIGGFNYLISEGANFVNCNFDHYPLYTSPGHAVISTGGEPYKTGIVANQWYDASQKKEIYSVEDPEFGQSPRHLASTTLGDELKLATDRKSKVVAISYKDRAAILLGGFMADDVLWYDSKKHAWTSSPFYFKNPPNWLQTFNSKNPNLADPNALTWQMTKEAVKQESLGTHEAPDLLAVNLANHDYVGHEHGPYSQEIEQVTVQADRQLSDFLNFLNVHVSGGIRSTLIVVTADHGVGPVAEQFRAWRIPAFRISQKQTQQLVEDALTKRFGAGPWVENFLPPFLYLNTDTINDRKQSEADVESEAEKILLKQPWIQAVFTRTRILHGELPANELAGAIARSFVPERSGNLVIVPKINMAWFGEKSNLQATHLTPYSYDTHVPLLLVGPNVHQGTYANQVRPSDIAPTLAYLLSTAFPAASEGKILWEALR